MKAYLNLQSWIYTLNIPPLPQQLILFKSKIHQENNMKLIYKNIFENFQVYTRVQILNLVLKLTKKKITLFLFTWQYQVCYASFGELQTSHFNSVFDCIQKLYKPNYMPARGFKILTRARHIIYMREIIWQALIIMIPLLQ